MKKTTTIIEAIKDLKAGKTLDKKQYKEYYDNINNILDTVYTVYQAREKGDFSKDSQAMTEVTAFLHTLGKANGKYISVCEAVNDDEKNAVLFDVLVYHSFKDKVITTSQTLAGLELEKSKASQEKNKAHKELIDGKGTAKAYKDAVKLYNEAVAKVEAEKDKLGSQDDVTVKQSLSAFAKFTTSRLKAIIKKRYALSEEEMTALRKLHNKEKADKKKQKKTTTTTEAKKPSKEAKPTTAKAKKPGAEALSPKVKEKLQIIDQLEAMAKALD